MRKYISELYIEERLLQEDPSLGLFSVIFGVVVGVITSISSIVGTYIRRSNIKEDSVQSIKYTKLITKLTKNDDLKVYVVKDQIPNAFFAGGNDLFLTSSLVKLLADDEVVSILCHEYGHKVENHITKHIIYNSIATTILFSLIVPIVILIPNGPKIMIAIVTYMLGDYAAQIVHAQFFGRRHEFYADSYAKKLGYGSQLKSALKKLDSYYKKLMCKDLSKEECRLIMEPSLEDEHPSVKDRIGKLLLSLSPKNIIKMFTDKKG